MNNFKPSIAVWEITMGCNMRCKHCGSSCTSSLPGELTTDEALDLCQQLASIGIEVITISGGEPLLRTDWDKIATCLTSLGIQPLIISNGSLVDEDVIKKVKDSGVASFGISVDGLHDTHDYMRCAGSFEGILKALRMLADNGIHTSVVTTVNKRNISELAKMKNILIEYGVQSWQLQLATPMGSFSNHKDELMIEPRQVKDIVDFAHEIQDEIVVYLGDCIGHYSVAEHEVRRKNATDENAVWQGCPAGKYSLGILHNGDIVGCNSIRSSDFVEGNIREKTLHQIWSDGFSWNRDFSRKNLDGFCLDCQYANYCLGGCPNLRLCLNGSIDSNNPYCLYCTGIEAEFNQFSVTAESFESTSCLLTSAMEKQNYNLAIMIIETCLSNYGNLLSGQESYLKDCLHFAYFHVERYEKAVEICQEILKGNENNSYALHGLAIGLFHIGKPEAGLDALEKLAKIDMPRMKETVSDICAAKQLTHSPDVFKSLEILRDQ